MRTALFSTHSSPSNIPTLPSCSRPPILFLFPECPSQHGNRMRMHTQVSLTNRNRGGRANKFSWIKVVPRQLPPPRESKGRRTVVQSYPPSHTLRTLWRGQRKNGACIP